VAEKLARLKDATHVLDAAEEQKYKRLGYLGLALTILGALCNVIAAYS